MEHKEWKRIAEDAETAILFIHGIVGTPNHFGAFVEHIPDNVSVYNMLLDGHGKGVEDFGNTSMEKWEEQVENAVEELARIHEEIYIVAHSMGSLFAIEQAIKSKKVTKLFLLAVPLKLFIKPRMITSSLKVYFDAIGANDLVAMAAKNCYGIERDRNPIHYIGWIPRFFELFAKTRYIRSLLSQLETPCVAYQSGKDELVSLSTVTYLKQNPNILAVILENSGHYYYDEKDRKLLLTNFKVFIDENFGDKI